MRYLSVCSGIEAATCAWHPLGWKPAAFSEIEKFPSAVLAHHYPDVPNLGDMTKFQEWPDDLAPDLIVGGTPCQSFSVAGLRKGLSDPRGNLALVYLAMADRYRPEWLVWENVPGVLSSNGGRDFGAFLGGLGQLGYGFAYRVLDAQYFGVAQRRRRVFVVANARDWRCAAAVLFERHSLSGNPAPRREAGEETPGGVGGSTGTGRWPADVASTLNAAFGDKQGLEDQHALSGASLFVPTTAHTLRGEGFDASEDGTGRGTPLVPVAFSCKDHGADAGPVSPTLRSMGHDGSHANGGGQVAIAFGGQMSVPQVDFELSQTLQAKNPQAVATGMAVSPAIAIGVDGYNGALTGDVAATMGTPGSSQSGSGPQVMQGMAVRRLTPMECERLQGFPDGYTDIRPKGKDTPDGPRYKALGNSMAVPCMSWLGQRIQAVADQAEVEIGKVA